ncbi:MAG TPA: hypothetical protein VK465_00440 [Fibrobacteria bacterium]|nr:hypothetical protein [Fibrobacteria bacterium]
MPLTFLLLQLANLALAAASAWIHFRNPHLWGDQAMVYSTLTGTFLASFTALLLGLVLVFASESRWASMALNLVLTLAFAGGQGWLLWLTGREFGLVQLLKLKLGL